ncbi:hypothetical protein CROQUDRAFT_689289 [Cronartium quercuum f. sp. fusiforme G11]|uniref:guanosine-diphosphatase n=1 Tax=Cronartium quercuum f. sp. fusiforme G11 TaxID=708437 RepID=A0A9P6NLF0_9BASI|nr:hypothetical protein CROQUDRAFT_689289 [Cronartium quercuum f. sp. fusiforme G11]
MSFLKRHTTYRKLLILILIITLLFFIIWHPNHQRYSATQKTSQSSILDNSLPTCMAPPDQPKYQFALMIDAGSTGSRIHVYRFTRCQDLATGTPSLPKLIDEKFIKIQPGLSAYSNSPKQAAQSLKVLLESAIEVVPINQRACTPIAVKATAGLRLLGEEQSGAIIKEVERWLRSDWPFSVAKGAVSIMDGAAEGVYAWVTINYLLRRIGPRTSHSNEQDNTTAAVLDLGGASTQIVFEPIDENLNDDKPALEPGEHVYALSFGGRDHNLYQHSHLGYGLMEARRSVHSLTSFNERWRSQHQKKIKKEIQIPSPCLVKDGRKKVELEPDQIIELIGTGAGFDACRRLIEVIMAKDAVCPLGPCAFGGVYQPRFVDNFKSGPIYALSYFYDRIQPLGLKSPFKLHDLRRLANSVCLGRQGKNWVVVEEFGGGKEAIAELEDRPEYCLDLTFMYSLLSFGYEIDDNREIVISKKIDGVELGWALGAAIAMIDGKIECRA